MSSHLQIFDPRTTTLIRDILADKHEQLGQLGRPNAERSTNARNYDSHIRALALYMESRDQLLPTKSVLENWRDDMLSGRLPNPRGGTYAVKTINARLSAIRKLLRGVADDVTDIAVKMSLRDWSTVDDARAKVLQDKIETDYGIRLTLESLERLVNSIPPHHLKGRRDRALVAVMAGAGLRVSEAISLVMNDVFDVETGTGADGIYVRRGKGNKARLVVLDNWNGWVHQTVQKYTDALALAPDARIFRGVQITTRNPLSYSSAGPMTTRAAQYAVESYEAEYRGGMVRINAHDLRRTFAKLSHQAGMSWEALREQMGHSSVKITETYVGRDMDYRERVLAWAVNVRWG